MTDLTVRFDSDSLTIETDASTAAALAAATRAEASSLAAAASGGVVYANTTAGLAATVPGGLFTVNNGDGTVTIYLDDAGSAVAQLTISIAAPAVVASRTALAALSVVRHSVALLTEAGRDGLFRWQSGDQSADVAADTLQGLAVAPAADPTGASGCWARVWDGVNGKPEWFGATTGGPDCLAALLACHALCPVMVLGGADYYITNTLNLDKSNRAVIGTPGSGRDVGVGVPARMGQAGGTRIILSGANVVDKTVCEFGSQATITGDNSTLMRNSSIRDLAFCRNLDGTYNVLPSSNTDPIYCVKGVVVKFQSACFLENVFSFDSPVGFHFFGCVLSRYKYLSAYRTTPSNVATNDFTAGFLLGNYNVHFYIASNASIYLDRPTFYDSPSVSALSYGIRVFGYISDTFIDTAEVGRCSIGIELDGRDSAGSTITAGGAHQDVRLLNPIIDAVSITGIQVRNLNDGGDVAITEPYVAAGAGGVIALNIFDNEGRINVTGGRAFGGGVGVNLSNTDNFNLDGMLIRDIPEPVLVNTCVACHIAPSILNQTVAATAAIAVSGASYRNRIAPQIQAKAAKITSGVTLTSACDLNAVDGTMIDYGGFATATAAWKVRYNGADARSGFSNNLLLGVTG